jgi:DNA-directed RNA polymerase specialized sigma24 family protein
MVEPAGEVAVDELDWLSLDFALDALQAHDAELAEVVHLRYFAGLSVEEIGQAMGRSERSINRDWSIARAWLLRRMEESLTE